MSQDKVQMPSSGGGIVRYFDDYKSKIEFSPWAVVIMIVVVILIEVFLYLFFSNKLV